MSKTSRERAALEPRRELDLDAFDLKILSLLHAEGRMSKANIAEVIGLSATPCALRIERLERARLIRGYHADVDMTRLAALSRYRVTVSLRNCTAAKARRFESAVSRLANIIECEAVLGEVHYVMTIVAASAAHFLQIMEALVAGSPDEFGYTTYPVAKPVKSTRDVSLLELSSAESVCAMAQTMEGHSKRSPTADQ